MTNTPMPSYDVEMYAAFKQSRLIAQETGNRLKVSPAAVANAYKAGDREFSGANLRDADLSGAYLGGAYLRDAYLGGANLYGANLYGAIGIYAIYAQGLSSRGDYLYGVDHSDKLMFKAGCWWGDYEEFVRLVIIVKGTKHPYLAAADFILSMWQLNAAK